MDETVSVDVKLCDELFIKLGFGLTEIYNKSQHLPTTARHTVDLEVGHSSVFVYSDLVEKNRIVGGQITELLTVIPLSGPHNSNCHYAPLNIEYRSMRFDRLEEIRIDLVGDTGKVLPFLSGKCILTLHIREKY